MVVIDQLRKIYPLPISLSEVQNQLDYKYKWFVMDDNEIIGICEAELTAKDTSVLATFLLPYHMYFPVPTAEEQQWSKVIHSTESSVSSELILASHFRFVYFSIKKNEINPIVL